jgi:hypothetical protein
VDTELTATIDPSGLATQATLAAILAKLSSDPATQTTLAAILAKITSDPATATKQDTGNGLLTGLGDKGFYRAVKEFSRPTNTDQYAANDCIAAASPGVTTQNIPNAGRINGGTGSIMRAVLKTDNLSWTTPMTLVIYDRAAPGAFIADNAAFDPLYADSDNIVGILEFPEFKKDATGAAGSFVRAALNNLNMPYRCAADSVNLYFEAFIPSGTPTPANGQKFKLNVGLVRD